MSEGVYLGEINENRKKQRRLWFWGSVFGGIILILLIIVVFLLRAPIFKVEAVEISGNNQVPRDSIKAMLYSQVGSGSMFERMLGPSNMLSWDSFSEEGLKYLPVLKNVSIEKNYSKKSISVYVVERSAVGIWCIEKSEPASCYWFDDEGVLFKPAFSSEGNLIRVVRDYAHTSLGIGHRVLSKNLLPNLFSTLEILEESDLSIKEVGLYDLSLEELEVATFNGPRVLFSLRFPPKGAAEVIESLRTKKNFTALNYIDFRVENRAYYK